ncbi:MAG: flhF [Firmicutes bacterium]|nr:flhF [Bacillota bacterium]
MTQVKNDLGRDAVILHTRRFRKGGVLGFFAKELVEIMAAVDTPAPVSTPVPISTSAQPPAPVTKVPVTNMKCSGEEDAKMTAMQMEITNMRKMIEQVITKLPQKESRKSFWCDLLIKNDIAPEIAENLTYNLPDETSLVGSNPAIVKQLLAERISNHLQRVEGIALPETGCKTVAFIGPTGVGKTTTIAKVAANFAINQGYKVALITADTYRISAVEQLKTYADIIGLPVDVVYTPDDLKAALFRHRDKNLVLLDTAGRSPRNQYQLAELQALLAVDPNIETHLVLGMSTKYAEALEIVNKFSVCLPQKFLFTKVDEACNLGTLVSLLYQFPATLSYITTGQNVPEDIELANPVKLANLILRD